MVISNLKHPLFLRSCRYIPAVLVHQSATTCKFDKYNFGKKASRKFRNNSNKGNNRGTEFFHLDQLKGGDVVKVDLTIRQKTLGNALHEAVNALLASRDVPLELQIQSVEVTKVDVSRDSTFAVAFWKMEDEEEEDFVEKLLKENIDQIRMVLPTYHHLTHTPTIYFVKDKKDSYLRRLNSLLNFCSEEDRK